MRILLLFAPERESLLQPALQDLATSADESQASAFAGLLQLVRALTAISPSSTVWGYIRPGRPPTVSLMRAGVSIDVWMDTYDVDSYANRGVPPHYRMQIRRDRSEPSKDARAPDVGEAVRRICLTLGIED